MTDFKPKILEEIFLNVVRGDIHASNKLDAGEVPLIGCGKINQGIEGYFNLSEKSLFENAISIAGDGTPLVAFYHSYEFGAKDNVVVCTPKPEYSQSTIFYLLAIINRERWRFSYGRKCYITKMKKKKFIVPVDEGENIDEKYIELNFKTDLKKIVTKLKKKINKTLKVLPSETNIKNQKVIIDELFFVKSGGAKKGLKNYSNGSIPYVSSGSLNNSVVGMVSPLDEKEITNSPAITVTAFCQARVQICDFIGRGNGGSAVKLLIPKKTMTNGELLWYASQLNAQSWKYNYGIMVSQKRLKQFTITQAPDEYKIDLDISNINY